ncbi:MAG: RidA family protein [Candidatus Kariarchaeaceae archaeon]
MKEVIHTDKAPKAIGPYSQGIKVGNFLFTAGQIPLNPETNSLNNANIEDEVNQIMRNLSEVAKAAGATLENVVKTTIFVKDLSLFSKINEIYGKYFTENPPARSTVGISELPLGVNVEIDMVIYIPN